MILPLRRWTVNGKMPVTEWVSIVRLPYICIRKGLPAEGEQRATLAAAGLTKAELAEAYRDDRSRRPKKGEAPQPERDHIIGAARPGDEVWVARLGVLATTQAEGLEFVARVCDQGAVLCCATTGRRYRVRSEAKQDVADALRLAADIAEDERKAVMERARKHIKAMPGAVPKMSEAEKERAARYWYDQTLTTEQATLKAGFAERTLYRTLGKRNRPAFGKAVNKRRTKPDAE